MFRLFNRFVYLLGLRLVLELSVVFRRGIRSWVSEMAAGNCRITVRQRKIRFGPNSLVRGRLRKLFVATYSHCYEIGWLGHVPDSFPPETG